MAEDGRKMSKSLGNVVNPDEEVEKWGADSLRIFEMFMGPLEDVKPWNTKGIVGVYRFLEKVWKLQDKISVKSLCDNGASKNKLDSLVHKTIKKVSEDIEAMRFNTAISALMILVNEMEKQENVDAKNYELVVKLLSPFAPFIAEEIWDKLGHAESIFKEIWPEYDPELIKDEEVELVIQVNGKVRDKIKVSADLNEEEAKNIALSSDKIKAHIENKEIKKIIFVKGKLVSIVV
jgi:leucyl-tRNA synthetase